MSVAPLLMARGTLALKTLEASSVIVPVLAIITPPVAAKGVIHSLALEVLEVEVLYCKVAVEP